MENETPRTTDSGIDLVVEVRGLEQGYRPVSASFRGISVTPGGAKGALATFEGPYEVFTIPGSKIFDLAVEAPIFVGLIAHAFVPAEGLLKPVKGGQALNIWTLAGFESTLTVTTRFFGYKAGSKRSPVQVGLSQLTGKTMGSSLGATHISNNLHAWEAPDFALTFQEAKIAIRPAGRGRLELKAEYSWNQGEWTAKTNGLVVLDRNPLIDIDEGELNTVLTLTVQEQIKDNVDGVLAGTVSGQILRRQ